MLLKKTCQNWSKALSPILIADAIYSQNTFGEDYSLYYTYTLINNAENLVIGHIPESIMPILKSLIPKSDEDIKAPKSGSAFRAEQSATVNFQLDITVFLVVLAILTGRYVLKKKSRC